MARRSMYDPLSPVDKPMWLVVRDALRVVVEARTLDPMADLRAILNGERQARIDSGWNADDIGRACSFFFCTRDGVRLQVTIEACDPADGRPLGHSGQQHRGWSG